MVKEHSVSGQKAMILRNDKSIESLLNQTFESANFPPPSWDETGTEWYHSTQAAHGCNLLLVEAGSAGHTGHFAVFDAFNNHEGTVSSLVTPRLHPTTAGNVLTYSVELYQMSEEIENKKAGAMLFIEFSTDNGITWTTSTTNVLLALPNYNLATTGWHTGSVSLASYNNQTVRVRFRAVSDWGWCVICIDNISGPDADILTYSHEIIAEKSWADFNGFGYYGVIPNAQLSIVDFAGVVRNGGSSAQADVTYHVNINNNVYSGDAGNNNPVAVLDTSATDTLFSRLIISATSPADYGAKLWFTQSQADQQPSNNIADSVCFSGSTGNYSRIRDYDTYVTPYSFGSYAPATTGMVFGATYHFITGARIDTVYVNIFKSSGTTGLRAVLFSLSLFTGLIEQVDSSDIMNLTPVDSISTLKFKMNGAMQIPAGSLMIAGIKVIFSPGTDTVSFLAQAGTFPGDIFKASRSYLFMDNEWKWAPVNFVPSIGMIVTSNTNIKNHNNEQIPALYPNPTKGLLYLDMPGHAFISVVNSLGQTVSTKNVLPGITTIDIGNMAEGPYLIRMHSGDKPVVKIINLVK